MSADPYLQSQLPAILQPGEHVLQTAYMRRQPGLLVQMLLVGGLLLILLTKVYYVVLTNRRLILIRTKMGFFGGPKPVNRGLEEYDVRNLRQVTTSGFANNRSMTFHLHQGSAQTLRISPWGKAIVGTKQFLEQVPMLVGSGQLAQLAAGAPPMQQAMLPPAQMQQPQMQPPQMMQQPPQMMQQPPQMMQQPPQMMQQPPPGFPPGTPVMVTAPDGNRYPGTIMQAANSQYLCQMPDGQGHWFPAQAVAPR